MTHAIRAPRGPRLTRLIEVGPVALAIVLIGIFLRAYIAWIPEATSSDNKVIVGQDYLSFYTAGRLGLTSEPWRTYDRPTHEAMQRQVSLEVKGHAPDGAAPKQGGYVWFGYPPTYLTVVTPFAVFPYVVALHVFLAATAMVFGLAIWTILRSWKAVLFAFAYPGAMSAFVFGQNAFLTAGLIGLALAVLPRAPLLAGLLVGALCIKPQLGLVFPVIFLATSRARAFSGAALGVAISVAVTLVLFGPETWKAWAAYSELSRAQLLENSVVGFGKMQSIFAAARYFGIGVGGAYALQAGVALVVAALVARLWRSDAAYEVKAAAAIAATLLMTPFCLVYDLLVLIPAIAFLTRAGLRDGFAPGEPWLLGLIATAPVVATLSFEGAGFVVGPIGVAVLFGWCLRRGAAVGATARRDAVVSA